jgi:hypothetical protein
MRAGLAQLLQVVGEGRLGDVEQRDELADPELARFRVAGT